jgi:hypothetical protein
MASQNMRAHKVASDLWKSGDTMSDMSHSSTGPVWVPAERRLREAAENVRQFEEW